MGNADACSRVPTQRVVRLDENEDDGAHGATPGSALDQYFSCHFKDEKGPIAWCCRKHSAPQIQHVSTDEPSSRDSPDGKGQTQNQAAADGDPSHDGATEKEGAAGEAEANSNPGG